MIYLFVGSSNTFYTRSYLDLLLKQSSGEVHFLNTNLDLEYKDDRLTSILNYKVNSTKKHGLLKFIRSMTKKIVTKFKLGNLTWLKLVNKHLNQRTKDKSLVDVGQYIKFVKPDAVIFFWGNTLQYEANEIYKLKNIMGFKAHLIINTYPVEFKFDEKQIPLDDRDYFSKFDSLIFPSTLMSTFFKKVNLIKSNQRTIVCPDMIISDTQLLPFKFPEKIKKIIFLGNVNFTLRNIDDIRQELTQLADLGIEVYIQGADEKDYELHRNIHTFEPFSYEDISKGKLIKYINDNFDAVFYGYNSTGSLREMLSITTRFSLCELANVPIVMKRSKYKAIEQEFGTTNTFLLYDKITDVSEPNFCLFSNKSVNNQLLFNKYNERVTKFLSLISEGKHE
ncbi:hypothetical protein ACPDKS_002580 [Vibrio cholerae]